MGSLIASQAISEINRSINRDACQKLQLLLETKHIYQRVLIEGDQIEKEITGRVLPDSRYDFDIGARLLRTGRFTLAQSRGPSANCISYVAGSKRQDILSEMRKP